MGSVRIMNKHFSFWIKFYTWKKVFKIHSWRLFKGNPSRKLKCQSKTFFLHEESISHNSNVIQKPSLFLLLHLLSLPSCRRYCFSLCDRWLFQIVYDVNGPISTTISMTMEYICCFFFFFSFPSLYSVFTYGLRRFITFKILQRDKNDSADLETLTILNVWDAKFCNQRTKFRRI